MITSKTGTNLNSIWNVSGESLCAEGTHKGAKIKGFNSVDESKRIMDTIDTAYEISGRRIKVRHLIS